MNCTKTIETFSLEEARIAKKYSENVIRIIQNNYGSEPEPFLKEKKEESERILSILREQYPELFL